jgi:CBS domain containing-hemolysin-like protein
VGRDIKISARTNAKVRTFKALAIIAPAAVLWLIALVQVLSAIFAERVFYAGRFTPFHPVIYREEPTLFVFVVVMSFVIVSFFGWVILGLIPKRDQQI